jgi:tRNA (guanine-N7-)-methyltransferase
MIKSIFSEYVFERVGQMRQRNKPWAKEKLDNHPKIAISDPEQYIGKWASGIFNNTNPIHIEVGTGKGQFISTLGLRNPEINYIGIELSLSVIVSALDKILDTEVDNVKLINVNAQELKNIFGHGEISRVYLNFSDPWPKNRHAKRRLTHEVFLQVFAQFLRQEGEIHFKTDNQSLFEFSLESFSKYGMVLNNISLDLHKSDFVDNVMTEYEEKFSEKGNRIYRCESFFGIKRLAPW